MRIKGKICNDILADKENDKFVRVSLGEARCPKCHKDGDLVCYIVYKEGSIKFDSQIEHYLPETHRLQKKGIFCKSCILALNLGEDLDEARVLSEVIYTYYF